MIENKNIKVFTDNIEWSALNQVYDIANHPAFKESQIRIMPDVHAGAGCVIGFTAGITDKVVPNVVGVDISCGMIVAELGKIPINNEILEKLDNVIRKNIPSGMNVHSKQVATFSDIKNLRCYKAYKDKEQYFLNSIGTLGGGNHFIELDVDENGNVCLVIHSGSRNLGKCVCEYYQKLAKTRWESRGEEYQKTVHDAIEKAKAENRQKDINRNIEDIKREYDKKRKKFSDALYYIEGSDFDDYLHDVKICQDYADLSRYTMVDIIVKSMGWYVHSLWTTIHNYIDFSDIKCPMVRKGAVSARKGEKLLIPINMRDGSLICTGKGNTDWNYSAPHGAGRIMSRAEAKRELDLQSYIDSMQGIYTTSVSMSTIDEAPFVYKPMQEIIKNIQDTCTVDCIVKPVYNFKAADA